MRCAPTSSWLLCLVLLGHVAQASEATGEAPTPTSEAAVAPAPAIAPEPPHADRLRDYVGQVRAQRRAQIERLRAESRDDSERARQQHRESADEQSRLHREPLERWREPQLPIGPLPPGEWSNPWYYRGW
jgi:hypothetical protein